MTLFVCKSITNISDIKFLLSLLAMICVQDKLKVSIAYTVRDLNRRILEEIPAKHPFIYIHGYNNIIPGLEQALNQKNVGESFTVQLRYFEAYGAYRNDLIIEVPKEELQDVGEIWIGMELEMFREGDLTDFSMPDYPEDIYGDESTDEFEVYTVKEILENTVILDGNHPFAGKDLIFEVKVLNVEEPSFTELETGFPDESADDDFFDNPNDETPTNPNRQWF